MGKASRRKQLDEQRKQFFAIHGDGRNAEDRANARAMLDALQKKLDDDALREDGSFMVLIHPLEGSLVWMLQCFALLCRLLLRRWQICGFSTSSTDFGHEDPSV